MDKEIFDPEFLYQAISKQRWKDCLKYFKLFKDDLADNPAASNAMTFFVPQFLKAVESRPPELYIEIFEYIYLMHYNGTFQIKENELEQIVNFYITALLNIDDHTKAIKFAYLHPEFSISKKIILQYKQV